jgi:outer membrane protein insertion porin family
MQQRFRNIFLFISAFVCLLFFLPSCRVAKNLPEGQSLLIKNKFNLQTKAKPSEKQKIREDLAKIAVQKPNRKFLGFLAFRMWMYYNASHHKKLTKFRQWILDKVGEAPVVYDSASTVLSKGRMENYLFNFGFFHNQVTDTFFTKNKKTTVVYNINTNEAWKIGEVELPKRHTDSDSIVRAHWKKTFLHTGDRFDITNLKNERDRIETVLRNRGYYYFNREYVTFDLDSTSDQTVRIKIAINPPNDSIDHQQYFINDIYVVTDYSAQTLDDSTHRDTITQGEYHFISQKMNFRKGALIDAIFFQQGMLYSKDAEQKTVGRLSQLGTFRFISIEFAHAQREGNYLDCHIYLTPAKKQSVTYNVEANVTNEGLFGLSGSLNYKNKNLTKRADQLLVDLSAGVQLRFSKKDKVQVMSTTTGASFTYYLNRFLVPFRAKVFSRNTNPRTRFNANYNFENRFDFDTLGNVTYLYQLHHFSFAFGYEWNENPFKRHLFNPITVSFYLLPKKGAEFLRRLDQNPILKSSYEEQIIIGPNYTFTYTNQRTNTDRVYMYFRTAMETAGNVIYGGFKLANLKISSEHTRFLIAKRPFAQYFRIEGDWRNYFRMTNHSLFAMRTFAGFGVPYGNSLALPFVKQFFVGGPNSLRGFLIREIGPGGYHDPDVNVYDPETGAKGTKTGFFNQTGDMKLEINAEIRFDIYKWLKAAVFADAGNVWLLKKDTRYLGEFNINRFWSEFAVDAGAGIRLDFNFFCIRFDYGFPLRDPRRVDGKRWQFENGQAFKNGQFQLAIGYPF